MQIEALKIYSDVVRFHSFSRGAAENGVLQSSASQTVQGIEESLGVTLIDRSCRPWELTDEGKRFYEGCREVLEKFDDVVASVKRARANGNSIIRVAAIYSVNMRDMTQTVQEFHQFHPGAKVEVEYAHPARVLERVLSDEVELGIISYPDERRGLAVLSWHEQEMVLVCPPQHRLAKLKSADVKQLRDEILVGFDADLVIAKKIDRFFKDCGIDPRIAVRFDNIEAAKRAVEAGSGVAILPKPTLEHELQLGTLAAVSLAGCKFTRPLGIIHRKGRKLYPNTEAFIEVLKNSASAKPVKNGDGSHMNGKMRGTKPRRGVKAKS
ncbi:MAG TPA: LysR family transcriptional regulator [Verrucomicrobiae bacterium]|jgi:DNA-binding transcriptional LysR family regulator